MREYAIKLGGKFYVGTRQIVRRNQWDETRAESVFSPATSMAARYPTASEAREQALTLCEGADAPPSMQVVAIRKGAKP